MKHLLNGIICACYFIVLQSMIAQEPIRLILDSGTLFLILIPCIIFSVFSDVLAKGIKNICKYVLSLFKKNPIQP